MLVIGPEGGLEAGEVARLEAHRGTPVHLGRRTLRFETAAIAALAAVLAGIGDAHLE
jgi:16S rRNA (uracil1498-N3)-methyltransferase